MYIVKVRIRAGVRVRIRVRVWIRVWIRVWVRVRVSNGCRIVSYRFFIICELSVFFIDVGQMHVQMGSRLHFNFPLKVQLLTHGNSVTDTKT